MFDARERRTYERELLAARRTAENAAETARILAETLQRTLLPPSLPEIDGIDLGGVYCAAGDGSIVGGDFYDVFEISDDAWGVVLGDVCGKGAEAAVDTALARYTVRASAIRTRSPTRVLTELHNAMEHSDSQGFCTAVYLRVRRRDDGIRMSLAVGGHHLPLLVGTGGDVREFGRPGALLGMLGPPRLHAVDRLLNPGESLVLFTDGVIEARRDEEFFGEERLHHLLGANAHRPAQEIADTISHEAIEFQRGVVRDDIAVVVLQVPPSADGWGCQVTTGSGDRAPPSRPRTSDSTATTRHPAADPTASARTASRPSPPALRPDARCGHGDAPAASRRRPPKRHEVPRGMRDGFDHGYERGRGRSWLKRTAPCRGSPPAPDDGSCSNPSPGTRTRIG